MGRGARFAVPKLKDVAFQRAIEGELAPGVAPQPRLPAAERAEEPRDSGSSRRGRRRCGLAAFGRPNWEADLPVLSRSMSAFDPLRTFHEGGKLPST